METVNIYIDKETIRVDDDRGTAYKLSGYYTEKLKSEGTLDDTELIGFGYEIFHSIFSTKERMDRITKRLDGLSNNEHLILTISSEILDVHNIPFELINRDGSDNGFLLKKRNISILRGIPTLDKKITSSPSPVRILIILSEPLNIYKTAPLDLLKELAVIYKALDEYIIKGIVDIDVEEKADKATIRERLLKGRYDIVHFTGHGSKGGELFIEDERDSRYARTIGADELKDIFKGSGVKLFYFDACETASSSEMNPSLAYHIYKGVPSAYVIANLVSVRDDAATDVTREIYKTIFDEGIENTLNSARLRLFEDWWKPVLFGESGKRLFEIKENHVIKKKRLVKRPPETAGNYVYRLAIVRNASDLIEKGNYLVLHGIGGAGKSTMANYLSRFYDAKFKNILFFDLKDKGITGPETLLNEILKGLAGEDIVKYDGIKGLLDSKKPVEILNRQKWRLITETLEEKTLFILDNLEETMQDEEGIIKPGWKDLIGSIMQTGNIFTIFTSRMIIRLNNREKLSNVLEIGEYERAEVGFLLSGMSEDDRDYFMSRSEEIYKKLGLHPLSISKAVETKFDTLEKLFELSDFKGFFEFYRKYFDKFRKDAQRLFIMEYPFSQRLMDALFTPDFNSLIKNSLLILQNHGALFSPYRIITSYFKRDFAIEDAVLRDFKNRLLRVLKEKRHTERDLLNIFSILLLCYEKGICNEDGIEGTIAYVFSSIVASNLSHELPSNTADRIRRLIREGAGINPHNLAMTLNNLGVLYNNTGRRKKAEDAYTEALGIYRELSREDRGYLPDLAMTLNNLGILYNDTGRREDAEKAYTEALGIYKKIKDYHNLLKWYPRLINSIVLLEPVGYERLAGFVCEFLGLYEIFKNRHENTMLAIGFFLKEKTFEGIDIKRLKEDIKESLCGQRLEGFLNLLKPLSLALDKESQKDLI